MIIQNRSARGYWIRVGTNADDTLNTSTLVAPGDVVEVTDGRGLAMIKAGTHKGGDQEIVEVKGAAAPVAGKVPGLSDLPEDKAIDLISKANLESLDKLTEGEKRPEVLSAVLKRKRG